MSWKSSASTRTASASTPWPTGPTTGRSSCSCTVSRSSHARGARSSRRWRPPASAPSPRTCAATAETERHGPYDTATLAADVAGLVRALGRERATVVAHDWGGVIGWSAAARHPGVVERLAVLNAPPLAALAAEVAAEPASGPPLRVHRLLPATRAPGATTDTRPGQRRRARDPRRLPRARGLAAGGARAVPRRVRRPRRGERSARVLPERLPSRRRRATRRAPLAGRRAGARPLGPSRPFRRLRHRRPGEATALPCARERAGGPRQRGRRALPAERGARLGQRAAASLARHVVLSRAARARRDGRAPRPLRGARRGPRLLRANRLGLAGARSGPSATDRGDGGGRARRDRRGRRLRRERREQRARGRVLATDESVAPPPRPTRDRRPRRRRRLEGPHAGGRRLRSEPRAAA